MARVAEEFDRENIKLFIGKNQIAVEGNGIYFKSHHAELLSETLKVVEPNDLIVTLGAGDIVKVGKKLAQILKRREK